MMIPVQTSASCLDESSLVNAKRQACFLRFVRAGGGSRARWNDDAEWRKGIRRPASKPSDMRVTSSSGASCLLPLVTALSELPFGPFRSRNQHRLEAMSGFVRNRPLQKTRMTAGLPCPIGGR